ncbi:MAG: transglycosylase SLT domain-containing protein [Candidatus Polarisedimenticolaceae bacterium]|nr:transglycosylase SLT domain-containing protein [Candidatus Polarisedimenticolaceae bacterium]
MGVNDGRVIWVLMTFCLGVGLASNSLADDYEAEAFSKWDADQQQAFVDYVAQEQREWATYKQEIEQQWAKFVGSTNKDWVEYSSDMAVRSIVDFKRGEIILEVVVPVDDEGKALTEMPKDKDNKSLQDIVKERVKQRLKALLSNENVSGVSPVQAQIKSASGTVITTENVDDFSKDEVEKTVEISKKPFIAKDGTKRIKAKVVIQMVPNHLKVRANRFKETVETYAREYGVDPSLIYAVIHTESYFNPRARSHVPAYGLMQLVPRSGGRDAYRYVKGRDQEPSPHFLYSPKNNILLGVAYLDLLSKREFKAVEDETIRSYLVIAAYNTGAGNVSRAFIGKKSIRAAIPYINRMSQKEVYDTLVAKLPYDETKRYIQKVIKRKALYENL